jgi:hypothetical protein
MVEGNTQELSARDANLLAGFIAIRSQDPGCELIDCLKGIVAEQRPDFIERVREKCREFANRPGTPLPLKGHLKRLSSMDQASGVGLDQVSCVELGTILMLADSRPAPTYGLETADAPFMRIMKTICKSGSVTADKLIRDDLNRLLAIRRFFPEFLPPLVKLARSTDWTDQMQAVEGQLDPAGASAAAGSKLDPAAKELLDVVAGAASEPAMHPLTLLLSDPWLSTMLPDEILAFDKFGSIAIQDKDEDLTPIADEILKGKRLGEHGKSFQAETIRAALGLRIRIAEHFRQLRLTAKFDVLESRWPGLLRLLQTDLAQVKRVEKLLLGDQGGGPSPTGDTAGLWKECQQDRDLQELFRMRPHFDELTLEELERYLKVSPNVSRAAEPAIGQPMVLPPVVPLVLPDYKPLEIAITKNGQDGRYSVSLREPASDPAQDDREAISEVQVEFDAIERQLTTLGRVWQDSPQPIATREMQAAPQMEPTLKEIGEQLYSWFFQGQVKERFEDRISDPGDYHYRIHLRLNDGRLATIPWESLYLAPYQTAITLTSRYSLIRYHVPRVQWPPRSFTPPLRILVVLPMPADLPRLNSEQEASILQRTLAADVQGGWVQLKFLRDEEARIEEFQRAIRLFNPHVFHFVGHGYFDPGEGKGYLVFQKDQKKARYNPEEMADLLRDSKVGVAVLNACDTGTSYSNDALGGIASALVTAGVPAVIATMRQVLDEAALVFTQEFYRSFVDGTPVEVAVVEARKALRNQKQNWSAYALFSGRRPDGKPDEDLKHLRLIRGATPRRSSGPGS